jgi:hypothetical protein
LEQHAEILSCHLPGQTEGKHKIKFPVSVVGNPAKTVSVGANIQVGVKVTINSLASSLCGKHVRKIATTTCQNLESLASRDLTAIKCVKN